MAHQLPKPHYQPQASDPAWLAPVVQFHGHLGPWVVAGARFGMAGLQAVGAQGYFDVELNCAGPFANPPQSCFLDGLQVATGATLGKRTLHWQEAEEIVVRVRNLRSGKTAELRPTAELRRLLATLKSAPLAGSAAARSHGERAPEAVEQMARKVAALSDREILSAEVLRP